LRTGILGGTFNPIHYGHLRPVDEVREALHLDQVRFVPLSLPAHKSSDDIAPALDRLEMVQVALGEFPHFVCDPIEIKRGGISYTVDTLAEMSESYCRGHDLFFIIGADAFSLLDSWREPLRLLKMVNFAVTLRGEQNSGEVMTRVEDMLKGFDKRAHFKSLGENRFQYHDSERVINFISVNTLNISATMIRESIRSRYPLQNLLPLPVEGIIIRRGLYGRGE